MLNKLIQIVVDNVRSHLVLYLALSLLLLVLDIYLFYF
ncbi:DUF2770 family protein [Enterobacillus tribolii]|uniref:Uncharacterized protein DUF2770 n=1 Tax=Enterobacillus tribolii TaxID=1487935 RepID=A0A370R349_9GAMM|nr:DUF2770 family protein [Enterobacillus tribolii]MBW7983927.1 DUF2770 domain-containing protein [Enterobacillus tribolii]RDK96864.1 uncharacterized protein DUF2770 [Enterobacillus tribolii]